MRSLLRCSDYGDEHTVLPEDQAFLFGRQQDEQGGQDGPQAPPGVDQGMLHDVLGQFVDERGTYRYPFSQPSRPRLS